MANKLCAGASIWMIHWLCVGALWRTIQPKRGENVMPAKVMIYGVKNCDTMKKARAWLEDHHVAYDFHDYKAAGIDAKTLSGWAKKVGWEKLLNRSGMTFRKLPDTEKSDLQENKALALMRAQPSMIKRPVLDVDGALLVGFKPDEYARIFARATSEQARSASE